MTLSGKKHIKLLTYTRYLLAAVPSRQSPLSYMSFIQKMRCMLPLEYMTETPSKFLRPASAMGKACPLMIAR